MGANQTVRSKKKGRTNKPFVMIYNEWLSLPAWKHLNGNAVKLLVHLISMSWGDNGASSERGDLFLSVRDAAKAIGVARNTASVAFALLIEAGWLRPVQKGHFRVKAGEKELRATVWRLTFQHHPQSRRGPTMDFRDWHPEQISRAQKLNATGSQFEPVIVSEAEAGAEIEAVAVLRPSEGQMLDRSKTEPHIDIAIGERSDGDAATLQEVVRRSVTACIADLDGRGRAHLARRVGITPNELQQFVLGRLVVGPGKLMAMRAAVPAQFKEGQTL